MESDQPVKNATRYPSVTTSLDLAGQRILVNGVEMPPVAYMSYFGTSHLYRQAAATGIHLYCFPFLLGDRGVNTFSGIGPFRPGVWVGEETIDLEAPLQEIHTILEADEDAWIIPRINLDPPSWWETAHPEACCRLADGTTLRQSFVSSLWRDATSGILRKILAELAQSDIAPRIIGIHVAGGRTSEWFYHFQPDRGFEDDNVERIAMFRAWLGSRYENESALRMAWQDYEISFGSAVPADIRGVITDSGWRDSSVECHILDTLDFHSQVMADTIAFFCRTVKEATDNRLLTGAFYGYHAFVNDPRWGHCALEKLLACPHLDSLASPNAYHRVPGEDWPPMVAVDSVRMHGKMWFAENDTRTHRTTLLKDVAPEICPPGQYADGVWLGPEDSWIAEQLLWKNAARMLACGYGGWWFDMWGGWFDEPALLNVLKVHRRLSDLPTVDPPDMRPRVCVAIDERTCLFDRSFGKDAEMIFRHRYTFGRIGAPCSVVLASDLARLPPESFCLVWILGDSGHSSELRVMARAVCCLSGHVLLTDHSGTCVLDDGSAVFSNDADVRQAANSVRSVAGVSGVHLYLETDDVLYVGRGWVGIHAVEAGAKKVRLPFCAHVTDAKTGERIATGTNEINTVMSKHETVLCRVDPV